MGFVHCYISPLSALPGETITIFVSTDQYEYQYKIIKKGLTDSDPLVTSEWFTGVNQTIPGDAYSEGCDWDGEEYTIPSNWASGAYYVNIETRSQSPNGSETTNALLVIKASQGNRNSILFQSAVNTAQAYNAFGGKSLYDYNSTNGRSSKVSFERPTSVDQFEAWEIYFLRWLEKMEYNVDFCTSIDIHSDPDLLNDYQLLLSVGHDEYWSWDMRTNVETFVANGGNVSFFSGNVSWWQVRYYVNNNEPEDLTKLVCYKDAATDPITTPSLKTINWLDVGRPENFMTGVSYNYGAFHPGELPVAKYKVRFSKHWLFKDTGLADNSEFGRYTNPQNGGTIQVIGYETDGAVFYNETSKNLPFARDIDNTPLNLVILSTSNLTDWGYDNGWSGLEDGHSGWASMCVHKRNGVVFTGGCINWSLGLIPYIINDTENEVHFITRNVIDILSETFDEQEFLVKNPGFEEWDSINGVPAGWYKEGEGTISHSSTEHYEGDYSLYVNASSEGTTTWVSQQYFPCQANRPYRISCYVKSEYTPDAGKIMIRLQNLNNFEDFVTASFTGGDGWVYIEAEGSFSNNPDDKYILPARVKIQVEEGYTAYFDEVKLVEL
jgi:hypothetical protein